MSLKDKVDWEVAMFLVVILDIRNNLSHKEGRLKEVIKLYASLRIFKKSSTRYPLDITATLPVEVIKFHSDFHTMDRDSDIETFVRSCLSQVG